MYKYTSLCVFMYYIYVIQYFLGNKQTFLELMVISNFESEEPLFNCTITSNNTGNYF